MDFEKKEERLVKKAYNLQKQFPIGFIGVRFNQIEKLVEIYDKLPITKKKKAYEQLYILLSSDYTRFMFFSYSNWGLRTRSNYFNEHYTYYKYLNTIFEKVKAKQQYGSLYKMNSVVCDIYDYLLLYKEQK